MDDFRWRSREASRIEGFSDAVFAFALTLLIVSLEVPKTSTELFDTMRGFGGFVITFVMLASIWYAQFLFFRRYGLEDRVTVVLNMVLLFTVLFFVYPLKFLTTTMFAASAVRLTAIPARHRSILLLIFGLGMASVFTVFVLLYRHAYRKRDELGLNELEVYETRVSIKKQLLTIALASTYFGLAGVFAMPHRTEAQQRLMVTADLTVAALMLFVFGLLLRLRKRRKRWVADWKLRNAAGTVSEAKAIAPEDRGITPSIRPT